MRRSLLYGPVWLPAAVMAALLVVALSLLLAMSWRSLQRLHPVHTHIAELDRMRAAQLRAEELLLDIVSGRRLVDPEQLQRLRTEIEEINVMRGERGFATRTRLRQVYAVLGDTRSDPSESLAFVLNSLREAVFAEIQAHDRLLAQVFTSTQGQFRTAAASMIAFPVLALLVLFWLLNRIVAPLSNLRALISLLAGQEYSLAETKGIDPLLLPIFENYNHLVGRLRALEQAHRARQRSLEDEVRSATRVLLEEQRALARAERLAAVGELAAGLTHELRNPLAGIQMALSNLRKDIAEPDQVERLDLVVAELNRLTRLLNTLLNQAWQAPEPAREVNVAAVIEELLTLVRYQVPAQVKIETRIPRLLTCQLPEDGLRQALLNLILNAARALGERRGTIAVSGEELNGRLQVTVSDDGPGFPPELLEAGIHPFATWREQGTGLGLATVRRFVNNLGGELHLANREPQGAQVILVLACKREHA